jgi:hypothetical protein
LVLEIMLGLLTGQEREWRPLGNNITKKKIYQGYTRGAQRYSTVLLKPPPIINILLEYKRFQKVVEADYVKRL